MDTADKDNQSVTGGDKPKVVAISGDTPEQAAGVSTKRTPIELALAIRRHAKNGKARKEVMHLENCTEMQYRHAVKLLGKFPEKNAEAFGYYVMSVQATLDELDDTIQKARGMWTDAKGVVHTGLADFKVLPSLYRVQRDLRDGIFEMAMKLGIVQKAAEKIMLDVKEYNVSFGDEAPVKPAWPSTDGPVM